MLEVVDLTAGYGPVEVLQGVSLNVSEQDSVAILGPNGCGKSTLLKVLFGEPDVQITSGNIHYRGEDITACSARQRLQRGLIFLPQNIDVFAGLSIEENLRIFVEEMNAWGLNIEVQDAYGLFPFFRTKRRQYAGNLSGGERRLLALARAILSKPRLALLDEPSAGLSPSALADVCSYIQAMKHHGTTVVIVEQNVQMALEIAPQCLVMDRGRLQLQFRSRDFSANHEKFMKIFSLNRMAGTDFFDHGSLPAH